METKSPNLEKVKERQARLKEEGLCITCGQEPAEGEGSTKNNCPKCATVRRTYYRDRYRKAKGLPLDGPLKSGRPMARPFKTKKTKKKK